MDANVITGTVVETTAKVFERMVHMKIGGQKYDGKISIPGKHLTAMVGFAGSYVGLAAIHCTDKFARLVGGAMLSMDPGGLSTEDVRDALGEVANMIAGDFKAQLAKTFQSDGEVFEQTVPSVISGEDYETFAVTDAPTYCTAFATDDEHFYVELALKKA